MLIPIDKIKEVIEFRSELTESEQTILLRLYIMNLIDVVNSIYSDSNMPEYLLNIVELQEDFVLRNNYADINFLGRTLLVYKRLGIILDEDEERILDNYIKGIGD